MSAPTDPMELLKLERGWDSYDGDPPDPRTVEKAGILGRILAPHFSDHAQYVPCADGSVQVEWHTDGWDVEMWIQRRPA